ncbi:hypothetical protein EPUS_05643 [Endocarpon pusillum Z07020]|uniref:protein-histidine N-methyltransferase n=1 Tax=Endocarpon pusillum (strain Z07020 / HMAS-L-300199) TaxID=1263415 RepID=U1HI04_ENDPU|nr:uncharacterized protein EPUS_05643 [Endocarpon pusillum Z07020]ERF68504.1 hypothetical protein EPUS_05643 [Endocarpon pusillum Z07020]
MASTFTFAFSGDDIDADADAEGDPNYLDDGMQIDTIHEEPELVAPEKHTLTEILSTLPSSLSYNTLCIPLSFPPAPASASLPAPPHQPATTAILRRALFDVVAQLKAEADINPHAKARQQDATANANADADASNEGDAGGYSYEALISTLEGGDDLRSRVYEGGFKTWECGFDLATYLAVCLYVSKEGGTEVDGVMPGCGFLGRWFSERGVRGTATAADVDRCWNGGLGKDGEEPQEQQQGFDVVELGAGSAMPSLVLLNHVLGTRARRRGRRQEDREDYVEDGNGIEIGGGGGIRFVLCDYNIEVLRLVTGANVLLQFAQRGSERGEALSSGHAAGNKNDLGDQESDPTNNGNGNSNGNVKGEGEGELDNITPSLLQDTILRTLINARISIDFISGAWGPAFVDLVSPSPSDLITTTTTTTTTDEKPATAVPAKPRPILILSSETIYSPLSLQPFVSTLLSLLQRSQHPDSAALVAAKKMYFGVGGGVDEFTSLVRQQGGLVQVVKDINDGGVGRVIVKVTLPSLCTDV